MADWQVALISAGAALFGASIGAATQTWIFLRGRADAIMSERTERKRRVYEEFLLMEIGMPELVRTGTIEWSLGNAQAVLKPFRGNFDRLTALLLLDAPSEIRAAIEVMKQSFHKMITETWPRLVAEDQRKPQAEQEGVFKTFDRAHDADIWPHIEKLSELMATELASREPVRGKRRRLRAKRSA